MASGRIADGLDLLQIVRAELGDVGLAPAVQGALTLTDAELRVGIGDLTTARRLSTTGVGCDLFPAWVAVIDASAAMAEGRTAVAAAAAMPHSAVSDSSSLTWTVDAALITALAGRSLGDRDRMLRGLDAALELAELEGFRRPFVTGGHAVGDLLDSYASALRTYLYRKLHAGRRREAIRRARDLRLL